MTANTAPIRASDKLQTLFERDDRLIDLLASHSPQLSKLRHSAARRVMARVTTVAQAARLCNLPVTTLVQDLNRVLGIDAAQSGGDETDEKPLPEIDLSILPTFSSEIELDVRDDLARGGEPFSRIMSAVAALKDGEALHLRAPFEPVPLFAVMEKRGFGHSVERHADDDWSVRFFHQDEPSKQERIEKPLVTVPRTEADTTKARTEVWLDVRGLEPPEPMVHTLEALESLPHGSMLVQINSRVPQFLLPILRERGFHFAIDESQPGEVQVRIWRNE
jgi:uncharacterized protein (DUF2249 family)